MSVIPKTEIGEIFTFQMQGKSGKIEIHADLPLGTVIEVLVLVQEQDKTEYLMSNPINRQHLLEALGNLESRENIVTFTVEEWNAKYSV